MQEKICSKGYENSENIGELRQECLDEYKIAGGTCAGENDINNVSIWTPCELVSRLHRVPIRDMEVLLRGSEKWHYIINITKNTNITK